MKPRYVETGFDRNNWLLLPHVSWTLSGQLRLVLCGKRTCTGFFGEWRRDS